MPAITSTQGTSRKQLYVVIGLGVALLAIAALQAPRFLGGGSSEAAPSSTTDGLPTSSSAGTGSNTVGFNKGKGTVLAGVKLVSGVAPTPAPGQLASFSLFVRHDPFVQLVKDADGSSASQDGEPAGVKASGGVKGVTASGSSGSSTSSTPSPSQLTNATIWVNGSDNAVQVKQHFPKSDPTFVLVGLKDKVAQIGVVGGSFTGGGTIALKMGQTLTLVNTATGARYTLKLLYTGSQPEQVQQFSQNGK